MPRMQPGTLYKTFKPIIFSEPARDASPFRMMERRQLILVYLDEKIHPSFTKRLEDFNYIGFFDLINFDMVHIHAFAENDCATFFEISSLNEIEKFAEKLE